MVARAKCKRGTKAVEKLSLLSPAAEQLIRDGGSKGSKALLSKLVVATTCTDKHGNRIVKKVSIQKGSMRGGARREVTGHIVRPPPQAAPRPIVPWVANARPRVDLSPGNWPVESYGSRAASHQTPQRVMEDNPDLPWRTDLSGASDRFYVHYGDATHHPMSTVSFSSKAAALKAVRESRAEGFPARLG